MMKMMKWRIVAHKFLKYPAKSHRLNHSQSKISIQVGLWLTCLMKKKRFLRCQKNIQWSRETLKLIILKLLFLPRLLLISQKCPCNRPPLICNSFIEILTNWVIRTKNINRKIQQLISWIQPLSYSLRLNL